MSKRNRNILPIVAIAVGILFCGSGCSLFKFFEQYPASPGAEMPLMETDPAQETVDATVGEAVASDVAAADPTVASDIADLPEGSKEDVMAAMAELRSVDPQKYAEVDQSLDLTHDDPVFYAHMARMIRAMAVAAGSRSEVRIVPDDREEPASAATPTVLGEMVSTPSRQQQDREVARADRPSPDTPSREQIAMEIARMQGRMNPYSMSADPAAGFSESFQLDEVDRAVRHASYNVDSAPTLNQYPSAQSDPLGDRSEDQSTDLKESDDTSSTGRDAPASTGRAAPSRDWRAELDRSIEALEREVRVNPLAKNAEMFRRHQTLRMLYALAGRRDEAIEPIVGLDESAQQFWRNQIYGLTTWWDEEHMPDELERAAAAKRYLTRANENLGELASLVVDNVCFCSNVEGRGVVDLFESNTFYVGQEVIIYAEVENFVGKSTPQGYLVKFNGSCQIFDSTGRMVDEYPSKEQERLFTTRHSKIHVIHKIFIPELSRGHYKLRLRIEDAIGGKINERELEFDVARR